MKDIIGDIIGVAAIFGAAWGMLVIGHGVGF